MQALAAEFPGCTEKIPLFPARDFCGLVAKISNSGHRRSRAAVRIEAQKLQSRCHFGVGSFDRRHLPRQIEPEFDHIFPGDEIHA
jgi:hypothetical protein